jgi:mono/diheme cytochrome c family protein
MKPDSSPRGPIRNLGGATAIITSVVILGLAAVPTVGGDQPWCGFFQRHFHHKGELPPGQIATMNGGYWMWVRSPEQEKVVVMSLFNRYCIRCHGVDGRGVWDIPGIPDFTDVRWQSHRTDDQIARIIIEGRGAVMPQFRGALSIEEAWGIARYLRTFVPGTEISRPDLGTSASPGATSAVTSVTPTGPARVAPTPRPAIPPPSTRGAGVPSGR